MKKYSHRSKRSLLNKSFGLGVASASVLTALLAMSAHAQSQYFTYPVTAGSTYSWDGPNWNASGSSANTGPYTSNWTPGDFARFYTGTNLAYTVTVNAAESMSGIYLDAGTANLTINDAGNGTGSLSIVPGTVTDGLPVQGFLTAAGTLTINAPITGTGAIEEESGGGHLQLYGNNTYSGGTLFSSSSTFVDYNSGSSFGTGPIAFANTTFSLMESQGTTPITLANNVQILAGTTGIDFIGSAPVTSSGNWAMGAFTVNIRDNGNGSTPKTPLTISGIMSGSGVVTYSSANSQTIILSGANTYTNTTVIGSSGDAAVTLKLGAANTLASSKRISLAGGTLDLGGYNHIMTGTTLGMTVSSTIDFEAGGSSVQFANSSGVAWTGGDVLNLVNWNPSIDTLEFGTDSTGLTSAQLADIEFNGAGLGTATLNSVGDVVPEPSTIALGVVGGLSILWNIRRKKA